MRVRNVGPIIRLIFTTRPTPGAPYSYGLLSVGANPNLGACAAKVWNMRACPGS